VSTVGKSSVSAEATWATDSKETVMEGLFAQAREQAKKGPRGGGASAMVMPDLTSLNNKEDEKDPSQKKQHTNTPATTCLKIKGK